MKKFINLVLVLFIGFSAFSQAQKKDSAWKIDTEAKLVFSQVSLTNWASGGESSVSTNAFLNINADYKKNKTIWENKLEVAYGLQKQGGQNVRKTDDNLYFSSVYGKKAFKHWYYTGFFSLKTQLTKGYNYPNDSVAISKFFAPAYILLSVGLKYKPNDFFSMNISPVSGRLTLVSGKKLSDVGSFGVKPGDNSRFEWGASVLMNFKKEIIKNVEMKTRLELFSNYSEHPENIDFDWQVFFNMKINSFMSSTLSTHLIYDDDINITDDNGNIGPRTQFKELFGLGFTIKF